MYEKKPFEYATIRLVPRVEREEFLNIGLVVYAAAFQFLEVKYLLPLDRINLLFKRVELGEIAGHLNAFDQICQASPSSGPIGKLDMASRFRWLTATRSTIIQLSKVHAGITDDARETFDNIFNALVL